MNYERMTYNELRRISKFLSVIALALKKIAKLDEHDMDEDDGTLDDIPY